VISAETWNPIRTFSSTMKNNSNIGRNLFYTVKDGQTGKYLGVICISSDFLDLTRDNAIGWSRDIKTQQSMINHTAIGLYNCYLYNHLVLITWVVNYLHYCVFQIQFKMIGKSVTGDTLVGVTTTSLYGNTKSNGLSQYDEHRTLEQNGFL
jgi:hypothetical protein